MSSHFNEDLRAEVSTPILDTASESSVLLRVNGVSKNYRLWEKPWFRLWYSVLSQLQKALRFFPRTESFTYFNKQRSKITREFTALSNVSFEIKKGESVGIIGRNGAGKSTLLQIIAGTLHSSSGTVEIFGKVAALLELGSGFNPEFTGRENIRLNAALHGISQKQIEERMEAILEFAGIGDFIDQPVKTYSSGMMMRLAFSVIIHIDADLLIIDEALAVGDIFFTQKCFQHLRKIIEAGTTLLFVSHDLASLQNLCNRGLLLHKGALVFDGPPEETATRYFRISSGSSSADANQLHRINTFGAKKSLNEDEQIKSAIKGVIGDNILTKARSRHGPRDLEVTAAQFCNDFGVNCPQIQLFSEVTFTLLLQANRAIHCPHVGINIYDRMNILVFAAGNPQLRVELPAMSEGDQLLFRFTVNFQIQPGTYTFSLIASEPSLEGPDMGLMHDVHEGIGPLDVYNPNPHLPRPFYGIAQLPMSILPWALLPNKTSKTCFKDEHELVEVL